MSSHYFAFTTMNLFQYSPGWDSEDGVSLERCFPHFSSQYGAWSSPRKSPGVAPTLLPSKNNADQISRVTSPKLSEMILSLPPPLMEIGEGELVLTMNKAERKRNFSPIPPLGTGGRWKQRPAILISPDSQPCNHITTLPLHHHYDGIPIIMLQILPW